MRDDVEQEAVDACAAVVAAARALDEARDRRNAAAVAMWHAGTPKRQVPFRVRRLLEFAGFDERALLLAGVSDANLRLALDRIEVEPSTRG